jgi:hypothetical protein
MTEAAAQIDEVVNDTTEKTPTDIVVDNGGKQEEGKDTSTAVVTDDKTDGDGTTDTAGDDKPHALPDNWRELAAGDDEDMLKLLKRYGSVSGVAKALRETQATLRSGKIKRDMPDAKDEKAMAEWRKEQGIPDAPEGYKLPETITKRLVDEDKPVLASFTEFAHGKNAPPAFVEMATEWYVEMQEGAAEQRRVADEQASEQAEDALRDAWSRDEFKGNMTLAKRFMESASGIGASWTEARLPDGRRIGDIPEFVQWASDQGRSHFGDTVFASADSESRHNNRKAEIEQIMNTDIDKYHEQKFDVEYAAILEREQRRARK